MAVTRHWSVSVERDGEVIVTIESNSLSGRDLSPEDEETIRMAARHLESFVGGSVGGLNAAPPERNVTIRCTGCSREIWQDAEG